jgi:hypothetical protein
VRFLVQPPVNPITFKLAALRMNRPSFAPGRGQAVDFSFDVSPKLSAVEAGARKLSLSADVYNMRGQHVRMLYQGDRRTPDAPGVSVGNPAARLDHWDGRDDAGTVVPGGIYLVRMVLEPGQGRIVAPVVVVR